MTTKCIVAGCQNHKDEGRFVGDLCVPCYNMITTGRIKHGTTFIHKLASRSDLLESAKKLVEVMSGRQAEQDYAFQMFMLEEAILKAEGAVK